MLFDVFQQYPAAMPILATVGGLIIGSFLNVVIWRYPIMLRQQMAEFHGEMSSAQSKISLALPRSHCPHCQQTIRVRDNIPLLSWLMLKGRCRDCQAKISKRYPLVELLTALAFLLASLVWPESGWALAVMILSAWLIAASIIDLDHQWLPDVFKALLHIQHDLHQLQLRRILLNYISFSTPTFLHRNLQIFYLLNPLLIHLL